MKTSDQEYLTAKGYTVDGVAEIEKLMSAKNISAEQAQGLFEAGNPMPSELEGIKSFIPVAENLHQQLGVVIEQIKLRLEKLETH
jgi:hypothetical protein